MLGSLLAELRELCGGDGRTLDEDSPLLEAGIDSLAAGELVSRCTAQTGVSLSLDILEELGTPRALAALVASAMAEKAPRSSHMQHHSQSSPR